MTADDPFWSDPFHVLAFQAFVQLAIEAQGWPDPERTRQLAYELFEEEKRVDDQIKEG